MKGYMYILECADGTYYTGSTKNLEKRLWEHENFFGANYTKKKHPVKLVYFEEYSRIDEAFYREKQIQSWSHAKKKALLEGKNENLKHLARKDFKKRSSRYADARLLDDRDKDCISRNDLQSHGELQSKDKVVECSERSEECIETTAGGNDE